MSLWSCAGKFIIADRIPRLSRISDRGFGDAASCIFETKQIQASQGLWPQGPLSRPRPEDPGARCAPTGARLGLALPPPLPHERPLRRLLLVLDVVEAPSLLLLISSSSSMLKRPCSSSILSRLMLLLLTARSIPRRPPELPTLVAEATRLMPGCIGLLVIPASSREDNFVRCSCWLIMLIDAWRGGDETKGLLSPDVGRFMARKDGLAPGCKLEFRSGDPTCPKAEAPGEPDSNPVSCEGRDFPHSDWNREGDA